MTVYKRDGSEFWWIEFQYKGERYRRSSETTSKRKAEELERKWREELRATALLGKIPELAWGDAIDRYFETVIQPRGNERAAKRDLYVLNALKLELGGDGPYQCPDSARHRGIPRQDAQRRQGACNGESVSSDHQGYPTQSAHGVGRVGGPAFLQAAEAKQRAVSVVD
ncbi:hypothetical protein ACJ41P_32000 [Azospirillum argentinense]|uniref:Uncharacterized protein n=1 Tax=Azospirillum argentinense TaxID=2970906 RepID=A0ABW8VH74_9PROT